MIFFFCSFLLWNNLTTFLHCCVEKTNSAEKIRKECNCLMSYDLNEFFRNNWNIIIDFFLILISAINMPVKSESHFLTMITCTRVNIIYALDAQVL